MAVFKVHKTTDYTIMSNYHLTDKRLTLKAKGLLSIMLLLSDGGHYSVAELTETSRENETAIKSALKELKEYGYLVTKKRMPNETFSGRIEYEYNIYEQPHKPIEQDDDNPKISKSEPKHEAYVYILRCGAFYKIGFSKDVHKRVKQLNNRPYPVEIIFTSRLLENAYETEQELHRMLSDYRIDGEWYDLPYSKLVEIISFIKKQ